MALNSPGVEVTIIDQSQYLPAAPNSVPLILVATAQNKATPSGTAIAPGTTAANAGKLYAVTSQRDLVNLFGTPFFYKTTNGTPIQGYELNEYGLQTAYSILGSTNLAYILRADIDLAALIGQTGRPSGEPPSGTYWLNSTGSSWGIREFNASTGLFTTEIPTVLVDPGDVDNSTGGPKVSFGMIGDYAINEAYNTVPTGNPQMNTQRWDAPPPVSYNSIWYKAGTNLQPTNNYYNTWVAVGSNDWFLSTPAVTGKQTSTTDTFTGSLTFTVTGVNAVATHTYSVTWSGAQSIGAIAGYITAAAPMIKAWTLNNRIYLAFDEQIASVVINDGVVSTLYPSLADPLFTNGSYNSVGISYATNAGMPLWKTTDATPRPTGSVWILTNTSSGLAPQLNAYNSTTGTWNSVPVKVSTSDWVYTNAVDSTGGKSIPVGSVYAQVENQDNPASPIQLWRRSATGAAVYQGAKLISNAGLPVTGTRYYMNVWVSVPGQSTLSGPYTYNVPVSTAITTAQASADWFVENLLALNIPNFTASSAGSYVTMTHTAGGVIILDTDSTVINSTTPGTYANPAALYGFGLPDSTTGAPVTNVTASGAKFGPYSTVINASTAVNHTTGSGTGAQFNITSIGQIPLSFTVPSGGGGTGYAVGDQISITAGTAVYTAVVATIGGGGAIATITYTGTTSFPDPVYMVQMSNWQVFQYIPNEIAVTIPPLNNTYWYYSTANQVDIMVNKNVSATFTASTTGGGSTINVTAIASGTIVLGMTVTGGSIPAGTTITGLPLTGTLGTYTISNPAGATASSVSLAGAGGPAWIGYQNTAYGTNGLPVMGNQTSGSTYTNPTGPIISATQPVAQSDGSDLVYGDLWVDTSDLDNYPIIRRWESVNSVDTWVLLDDADQTTQNGILFADARWAPNGEVDAIDDPIPTIQSLLTSNYLDLDAPDPALYPQGMLLFNTRRSGYNVKQYKVNYFNAQSFPDQPLPQETSTWVTAGGLMPNGAPYMGRKAQRNIVVQSLKSTLDSNTSIREEDTFINLLACPNYPELQPNMVVLNNDRNNTSYIIGDTPLRLAANATDILAWATNAAGATATGDDGLVTRDTYMGIYYPSAIGSDLTGAQVVLPSSYMMLKTMLYNDTVAYPWFAPAGQRRGVVSNVTNIGYLDAQSGEFITDKNRVSLRDVEYQQFINPIAYFSNVGILNYGNKNSFDSQSALDRTNVARLICYLRYNLQKAVRPFLFEPNDAFTRGQVRGVVQTLLADVQSKRGIYDYLVICDDTNNTPARIDRNELWVDVAIEPVKAVEFIYIPVRILNTGEIAGLQ